MPLINQRFNPGTDVQIQLATEVEAELEVATENGEIPFSDEPIALVNCATFKGSRYLVKDSGTSQSPKSTRQRAKLRAASVLFPARLL